MSYRIVYGPERKAVKEREPSSLRFRSLIAGFLLLFAVIVKLLWPEGTAVLRQMILPTDLSATEQAFQCMMEDLRSGENLGDAITVFCRQIIENE